MKTIVDIKNITKQYKGKTILEDISFSLFAHQVVALVGKNGSGKSTLLKIIGGLVNPDSGTIYKHIHPFTIGYVPEVTPSTIMFTPEEYLFHMGCIRGMVKNQLQPRIDYLLDIFNLQGSRKTRISDFSKGMKQKVMIMQALLEETNLLILDEPLSGLDPKAQSNLEDTLLLLKDKGLSIILSCHETKLLENIADKIFFINNHQVNQNNLLLNTTQHRNRLTFEISIQESFEDLHPYFEIVQTSQLNQRVNVVKVIIKLEDTDKILLELLHKNASIKQLQPINHAKEDFYNQF
ncbi:ABC transporter ATP-binding protein [Lysinibacillus contaminans]|uniref:ABC transporter ATP-binding protein n=1 Tax=Lysinibacillus contaminans TaxID=1293441 RepID=A0ABR5K2R0_9BACI|nr:ABC transporter ATP-binding protein [Lysinibacillus contaminans]KOS69230.1 ABC transporter ATP-binding protein [Lysinibacillus contaminans]